MLRARGPQCLSMFACIDNMDQLILWYKRGLTSMDITILKTFSTTPKWKGFIYSAGHMKVDTILITLLSKVDGDYFFYRVLKK